MAKEKDALPSNEEELQRLMKIYDNLTLTLNATKDQNTGGVSVSTSKFVQLLLSEQMDAIPNNEEHRDQNSPHNSPTEDQNAAASVSTSNDDRHRGFTAIYSYNELAKVTSDFDPDFIIGRGSFGPVYKGKLKTSQIVAVKKLDDHSTQGERQFLHEIIMLSILRHPNIIRLIGFSAESVHGIKKPQRLLVYEYMPLGSLHSRLHDLKPNSKPLDWETRMTIALGIAEGLNYLHNEVCPCVIFRDLCTSNILLDKSFQPILSDFGFSRFGPTHEDYKATAVKLDVSAYGSVLLELITGQRTAEISGLFDWVRRNKLEEAVDPRLEGKYERRSLCRAADVALACLFGDPFIRPRMGDVVRSMKLAASEAQTLTQEDDS